VVLPETAPLYVAPVRIMPIAAVLSRHWTDPSTWAYLTLAVVPALAWHLVQE